jgi:hypothetical protein
MGKARVIQKRGLSPAPASNSETIRRTMAYDATNFDIPSMGVKHEHQEILPSVHVPQEVQLLMKVRELITKGWCQCSLVKRMGDGNVSYCAMGAFQEAASHFDYECNKQKAIIKLHNAMYPKHWWDFLNPFAKRHVTLEEANESFRMSLVHLDIMDYNDRDGRSKEDILSVIDKAIKMI